MDTQQFWTLIDQARAGGDGDTETVAARLESALADLEPSEIVGWDRHLWRVLAASYREDLWGAAYLINGGCSDDGFDYFRGWLMAQGREVFARAVAEPDSLAESPAVRRAAATGQELEAADMIGVAFRAHLRATGAELPAADAPQPASGPEEFWDFDDEDEARRRLPKLAALFVEPPEE
ncbi:Protein of unknown function [Micromonospora pattaloongensis]|uniref:DUF4240 domain-containing protein n=1 Tax=Micromonospora pattaloongensis TaxID=405436 RepID=A0A1H3RKL7_9ACTN|nr:DUF4240 domain-containing protein [Micromonospora pattaloongensis]SDZ26294.1 Protein of unknown function [Micromonospora pattaloongensis]